MKYLETPKSDQENEDDANDDDDIEAQIRREVEGMKPSKAADSSPFQIVKLDIECSMTTSPPPRALCIPLSRKTYVRGRSKQNTIQPF